MVCRDAGISPERIACLGISNQRETTAAWNRSTGKPICDAIVWQCARSQEICDRLEAKGYGSLIREQTGLLLSPYFPASKMAWILEHIPEAAVLSKEHQLCMGTIDSYLIFRLTEGRSYQTDYSNASRTHLFNLQSLCWDDEICRLFGISPETLPAVCDSDAVYGLTDLEGLLEKPIPICGVLGDSQAALFGQGCHKPGMTKATYGTGSSVVMNIGSQFRPSPQGIVTSLAWRRFGQIQYIMEGNINYTGAVITWLKEIGLISTANETLELALKASPKDTTILVPAFTGLGAPCWKSKATAVIGRITRRTGKPEIVRAALDSIAFQILDVVKCMEKGTRLSIQQLFADGGATQNAYLMQTQSDLLDAVIQVPETGELSGLGAAYMAGLSFGIFQENVFESLKRHSYRPAMSSAIREWKCQLWHKEIRSLLNT